MSNAEEIPAADGEDPELKDFDPVEAFTRRVLVCFQGFGMRFRV